MCSPESIAGAREVSVKPPVGCPHTKTMREYSKDLIDLVRV